MFQRHPIQNEVIMFITTNTKDRQPFFADPMHAKEAVETLYRVQLLHPFFIYGFVIMPDHGHFLLKVAAPGSISAIMRTYKYGVTFNIGIGPIWQSRFHMVMPEGPRRVLRYIHNNPVQAGLVSTPEEYPWSSASGRWDVTEFECL